MNLREVGRGTLWFAIGAIVLAVAIFLLQLQIGLHRDSVTIRSYPVTPEIAGEMRSALYDALNNSSKDGAQLGRVTLTADGRLLVTAPESAQRDVQRILAEVAANKPEPTPAIRFDVWLVSAALRPAAPSDSGPGLVEVGPALADIQKVQGPMHFELIEKLALQARAGNEDSQIQGAHFGMRITPTVRHDSKGEPVIAARINVEMITGGGMPSFTNNYSLPGSLRVQTEVRPGQLLVIGQSSLPVRPGANPTPDTQEFYIVRASL
jgi:hypothetical protein